MIASLTDVTLKNGETMTVSRVEPPAPEYARRLCHFLEHKAASSFRGIKQRLDGRYAAQCVDRYFVGEIDGRIAGQVWYGLPRHGTGVGNFGHVYTEPIDRGKGVATALVRASVEDFAREADAKCLLCGAGPDAAPIYLRFGFELIKPGADRGPMALVNRRAAADFADLDERYFAPGLSVTVRHGHIGDRHDCDRMLDFSRGMVEWRARWRPVLLAHQAPTFMDALFAVEDGRGLATVLENAERRIMGYAFVLGFGPAQEHGFKVMDFAVHPNYLADAPRLVEQTAGLARAAGVAEVRAFVASCDSEKLGALRQAGFGEEHRFGGAITVGGAAHDIVAMHIGL